MQKTISYYEIVDASTISHDNPFKLVHDVFTSQDACTTWLYQHAESIQSAIDDGIIDGVSVKETRQDARFIVVGASSEQLRREVPSYLGFGARILAETPHFLIVGIPAEHAYWQSCRLGSGLHYTGPGNQGAVSLEDAIGHAEALEQVLYGPPDHAVSV